MEFSSEFELQNFISRLERETIWLKVKCNRKNLHFKVADNLEVTSLEDLQEQLEIEKTGIMLELNERSYFIRPYAIKKICHVLKAGTAVNKMTPTNKRIVLNKCVEVCDKEYLYFKIRKDWIIGCNNQAKKLKWKETVKEVSKKMMICNASFFYGVFQNDTLTLLYRNKEKNYKFILSEERLREQEEREDS